MTLNDASSAPLYPSLDGVSTVALLVLVAFVIERLVSAILFFLVSVGALVDPALAETPTARVRTERAHQWWRFLFAGAIAAAVLSMRRDLGLLHFFGLEDSSPWLDPALTWVVLLGGADRIAALVKLPPGGVSGRTAPPPLKVEGFLQLDDRRTKE